MERDWRDLVMVIFIKVIMLRENPQVLDSITGQMQVTLKEHLKMGYEMAKVYGKKVLGIVTNTKDNI